MAVLTELIQHFVVARPWGRHGGLFFLLGVSACGGLPSWPVGVPPAQSAEAGAARAEAKLPLCAGQPSCPDLEGVRSVLAAQASRCSGAARSAEIPREVEDLLMALAQLPPSSARFPASFAPAPAPFRQAEAVSVVDARQDDLEVSAAVLFHGLWWTFWDRGGIGEVPTKAVAFTDLILFPDFEGRQPCKEW